MNTFSMENIRKMHRPLCYNSYGRAVNHNMTLRNNFDSELEYLRKSGHKMRINTARSIETEQHEAVRLGKLKDMVNDEEDSCSSAALINKDKKLRRLNTWTSLLGVDGESANENNRKSSYRCCKHRLTSLSAHHHKLIADEKSPTRTKSGLNNRINWPHNRNTPKCSKGYMLPTSASLNKWDINELTSRTVPVTKVPLPPKKRDADYLMKHENEPDYSYSYVPRKIRSRRQLEEISRLRPITQNAPSPTAALKENRELKLDGKLITNQHLEAKVRAFLDAIEIFNKSKKS